MQFSFTKRGFTMFEMVIVISIIMFIFYFMSRINFRPQEDSIKAERIATKIHSILHSNAVSVMMWKMDPSRSATQSASIRITASGSASPWIIWSLSGTTLSWVFLPPFFDTDSKYEIRSIRGCNGSSSGTTSIVDINMTTDAVTFSGTFSPSISPTILEIRSGYNNNMRRVVYDRRTGRIEIRKDTDITCQ